MRKIIFLSLLLVATCYCLPVEDTESISSSWYFRFREGKRIDRVVGIVLSDKREIIYVENLTGRFDGEQFISVSDILAPDGTTEQSTSVWFRVRDHFESESSVAGVKFKAIFRSVGKNRGVLETFSGGKLTSQQNCEMRDGVMYGSGKILSDSGEVLIEFKSESK